MKLAIVLLATIAVALAAPQKSGKFGKMHFRNLYVKPLATAHVNPSPRIINGQEADPHSIPYQAFLEVDAGFEGWYCGGVLLTPKFVITAGHCTDGGETASIVLGAHRVQETEDTQQALTASRLITHEKFNIDLIEYDIGLIELSEEAEINDYVGTIRLPADNSNDFVGSVIRVSGWGLTDGFGDQLSDVLNYVENPVITNDACNDIYGIVQDYQICMSGDEGRSTCNGDSGGPATIDGVLVGLVSYGVVYCQSGYPSAFTRTSSFIDWVQENSDYTK